MEQCAGVRSIFVHRACGRRSASCFELDIRDQGNFQTPRSSPDFTEQAQGGRQTLAGQDSGSGEGQNLRRKHGGELWERVLQASEESRFTARMGRNHCRIRGNIDWVMRQPYALIRSA